MTDFMKVVLLLTLLSPGCVMQIGGDNVTTAPPSSSPSAKPSLVRSSAASSVVVPSSSSSSSSTFSTPVSPATPLSLPLVTDFEPALVAHVYDSTVNFRHRHHPNHPWGPHFEENVVNITVREFQNVHLDCRVGLIEDKMVSWVRRKFDQLELLTLGIKNHSSDPRFTSEFRYPNNWRLGITNASRNDSGVYLCQISTHPPKVLEVQLTVEAPEVFVISSRGERVQDVYYKEGSTLQLICEVNNVKSRYVNWYHNSDLLNHDITRGGVSIKTEIVADHAKSILNLARITRKDIGTYLCSAPPQNATVTVHVLNGENPAELYHNGASCTLLRILHSSSWHPPSHNFVPLGVLLLSWWLWWSIISLVFLPNSSSFSSSSPIHYSLLFVELSILLFLVLSKVVKVIICKVKGCTSQVCSQISRVVGLGVLLHVKKIVFQNAPNFVRTDHLSRETKFDRYRPPDT